MNKSISAFHMKHGGLYSNVNTVSEYGKEYWPFKAQD